MVYKAPLCLALLAQCCNLWWDVGDVSNTRLWSGTNTLWLWMSFPSRAIVTSRWAERKENIFEGYFNHRFKKKRQVLIFFFFSEELKMGHRPSCMSTVGGRVFCWLPPGKSNTFRSLKSHPVRNLCYGWNSRLNFTLANCYPDTMLNKFLFSYCFFHQWRRGILSADQRAKMRVRLGQSGVRQRLSQPLQN